MRKRLILLYLCLMLLATGLLSLVSYRHSTALYRQEVAVRLLDIALLLEPLLPARETKPEPGAFDAFARQYAQQLTPVDAPDPELERLRITFIRTDGVVVGDSEYLSENMENHAQRPEVLDAFRNETGRDERISATISVPLMYHARFFPERELIIRLSLPLERLAGIAGDIVRTTVLVIFGCLLLTAVLARILSRYVISPVTRLSGQMKEMSETDYSQRLRLPPESELGGLTQNVNQMAERLENSIAELGDRNAKVNTIINSLQNGLVAVDRADRLVMVNPVVFGMFGMPAKDNVLGKPVVEVFRNRALLDLLERAMSENQPVRSEVNLYEGGKRVLEVHASPILPMNGQEKNSGALAHVADVTTVRRLEEIRSEFVSNVTHELKTPLTSIRGFVETLRAGAIEDPKVADRFLDIIEIETDRLSVLIDDILSLSEIEGMKKELSCSTFPLEPLVDEVKQMLEPVAAERNISVHVEIPEEMTLLANRNRIKQLLINLMDNGIKYNREGGTLRLEVRNQENKRVEIRVSDTGIGIPEMAQKRVFERFYRVDKGRARAQGGTGLGLSIVKHIAQLYNGSVALESELDKGSTFVVMLNGVGLEKTEMGPHEKGG